MTDRKLKLLYYWRMSEQVARAFSDNPITVERATRLVFGTGLQESNYHYNRQISRSTGQPFTFVDERFAFGLWQQEKSSVFASIAWLESRPDREQRAVRFLYGDDSAVPFWRSNIGGLTTLSLVAGWDRLSCLLCRVHYLRDKEEIPDSARDQADYWSRKYNTRNEQEKEDQWFAKYTAAVCELGHVVVA